MMRCGKGELNKLYIHELVTIMVAQELISWKSLYYGSGISHTHLIPHLPKGNPKGIYLCPHTVAWLCAALGLL